VAAAAPPTDPWRRWRPWTGRRDDTGTATRNAEASSASSRQRTCPGWHEASPPGSAARRTRRSPAPWMSSAPSAWISSPAARRAGVWRASPIPSCSPSGWCPATSSRWQATGSPSHRTPAGRRLRRHHVLPGPGHRSRDDCCASAGAAAGSIPPRPGPRRRKATAPGCSWSTTASTVMTRSSSLPAGSWAPGGARRSCRHQRHPLWPRWTRMLGHDRLRQDTRTRRSNHRHGPSPPGHAGTRV